MENIISVGLGITGLLGGVLSWMVNLKIKTALMENTLKLEKDISLLRDEMIKQDQATNDNLIRELALSKEKAGDRIEKLERDFLELKSSLSG